MMKWKNECSLTLCCAVKNAVYWKTWTFASITKFNSLHWLLQYQESRYAKVKFNLRITKVGTNNYLNLRPIELC